MLIWFAPEAHLIVCSNGAVRYYCTSCRFTTAPCRHFVRA
jgi:hypothetical protein